MNLAERGQHDVEQEPPHGLSPRPIAIPTLGGGDAGYLSVVEPRGCLPFTPARLYYIHSVPAGTDRGAHAHRGLEQFMICMNGTFRIELEGRGLHVEFTLDHPSQGLYIPPGYWRNLHDFSSDAVCAVLASEEYDEADYIRDYATFKEWDAGNARALL